MIEQLAGGESAGLAAAFLGLPWRAMWRAATVTDIDADTRQAQAAALQADGHDCDEGQAQAGPH